MRLRNICFTINNWTNDDYKSVLNLSYKYLVVGKEVGDSGTPHLQGYIEFPNALTFKSLKKKLPTAHMENRKGKAAEAADYCKKDGEFFEDGEISKQGKRSDIERCVELITDGNSLQEVAKLEPNSYVKFHKGFKALKAQLVEPRNTKPIVQVFHGPTGTGKSYAARELMEMAGEPYYVWTPARGKWWDGYDGHKCVILEEFRGQLTLGYLLVLLDRYECPIEYKGGTQEFVATRIVITSPKHPEHWYPMCNDSDKIDQLLRRIDHIEEFDTKVNDTEVGG